MDDLLTISDDNIGGLQALHFAPHFFFSSFSPLVFNAGYSWIKIECIPETSRMVEETVNSDQGSYQNIVISGSLPKIRPGVDAILKKYRTLNCVVKVPDQNGNLRLAGTSAGELPLLDTSSTGEKAGDENGYVISFKGRQQEKALYI